MTRRAHIGKAAAQHSNVINYHDASPIRHKLGKQLWRRVSIMEGSQLCVPSMSFYVILPYRAFSGNPRASIMRRS